MALYKPGVCETKDAKHKLLINNESVQQTTGAEGKALKLYGGPREEHCTNSGAPNEDIVQNHLT